MGDRVSASRRRQKGWLSEFVLAALCSLLAPEALAAADETVAPVVAAGEAASTDAEDEEYTVLEEVVVYGDDGELVAGLVAEATLDAAGVAAYGADTVGDLLAQVAPEVDNSEQGPVILVNGRPRNGIRSVNDLPAESVQRVEVLPAQAAVALGYEPTRRVINVVLKQSFGQKQGNATVRGATAGRGVRAEGNVGMLRLEGNSLRQFTVRAQKTEPLLEAHRGIQSQLAGLPYDLSGNVLSWPITGGDIDPQLSAITGYPVTVLGVPAGLGSPTLDDLVPMANHSNVSDMGRYRTLVSDQYNIGINANYSRPLQMKRGGSLNLNLNADFGESSGYTGASTALLHVPASSPFSPFSQDVGIARYLGEPLRQQSNPVSFSLGANVNLQLFKWRATVDTNINWRNSHTMSERRVDTTALQAAIDAGTLNPFEALPLDMLGEVLADNAKSRGLNGSMMLMTSGTVFKMPAGNATVSIRGELRRNESDSRTVGINNVSSHRTRFDKVGFTSLQLPLYASKTPQTGFGMGAELSGAVRDVSRTQTIIDHGYGLNWRWGNRFNMRASINHEKVAPQPESLTNPIVTIDDYRAYDFIRQETVLVRYITGGNPDLGTEKRRIMRFGGQVKPFAKLDLNLNAEYQRTIGHDQTSALPAVSEDVQEAFPDRYRRDASGRLVEIDARLVSFARSETEQLRWGGNFRRTFGVPAQGQSPMAGAMASGGTIISSSGGAIMMNIDGADELGGPGWRLSGNFTHTLQLTNTRLAREGLPEQDLLAGGVGTGSSQSRHQVQGRMGLAFNGTGLQLNTNWKSGTRITAGTASDPNNIEFDPLLQFNLSAFTNLGTVFPGKPLLANSRVTLAVDNLLDAKQRVTDETGATPLRYQPYLINSLGRTVSLSLRKAF